MSQALLSLAFPTLLPCGHAEFTPSQPRGVDYAEYIQHLIKHESGISVHHPRSHYVAFNTIMHRHYSAGADFLVQNPQRDCLEECETTSYSAANQDALAMNL